jgi:hypothetical protein
MASMGLAPSPPCTPSQTISANGSKQMKNTAGFKYFGIKQINHSVDANFFSFESRRTATGLKILR